MISTRGLLPRSSFNRDFQLRETFTSENLLLYHLCKAKHHKLAAKNTQGEIKVTRDSRSFPLREETETNLRKGTLMTTPKSCLTQNYLGFKLPHRPAKTLCGEDVLEPNILLFPLAQRGCPFPAKHTTPLHLGTAHCAQGCHHRHASPWSSPWGETSGGDGSTLAPL